jgi:hypothetical protein
VTVSCDERCAVTARARIAVPGHAEPVEAVRSLPMLGRGRRATLRLVLSRASARAVRRALHDGRRVRGTIRVVARDAAGNRTVRIRPVLVFL